MRSSFSAERFRASAFTAAIIAISFAGALLLYGHTRDYGFDYDDYHFIRPYRLAEVAGAFRGPWDTTGIEVPFYRPLTVAFFAARFELFGLNSAAHHLVSLLLFACSAALTGFVAWRMLEQPAGGVLAAALFIAHPAMPYAQVAWVTNQMHLLESLVVLCALLWWTLIRRRGVVWWLPLLAFAAAAFLIKEDGIMLIPAVLALHILRRLIVEPTLPPPRWSFLIPAVCVLAALVLIRSDALGARLGGYGRPTSERAWQNYSKGLNGVLRLVPADRPWQPVASAFATALPLLAILHLRRASASSRYCLVAGAVAAALFNLPFVFVSKAEQYHLVALGAVLVLSGSAAMIISAWPRWVIRAAISSAVLGGVGAMAAVARNISTDFDPYGPIVRSHDGIVTDWSAVPEELRTYLKRKLEPGQTRLPANPVDALTIVGFGLHGVERSPAGLEYRWMSASRAEIHVAPTVREVVIPFRHDAGAFQDPASVHITANNRPIESLTLRDAEWRTLRIPVGALDVSRLRRFHRIAITIDHAWVPAERIPGSADRRTLGLQLGTPLLR